MKAVTSLLWYWPFGINRLSLDNIFIISFDEQFHFATFDSMTRWLLSSARFATCESMQFRFLLIVWQLSCGSLPRVQSSQSYLIILIYKMHWSHSLWLHYSKSYPLRGFLQLRLQSSTKDKFGSRIPKAFNKLQDSSREYCRRTKVVTGFL